MWPKKITVPMAKNTGIIVNGAFRRQRTIMGDSKVHSKKKIAAVGEMKATV